MAPPLCRSRCSHVLRKHALGREARLLETVSLIGIAQAARCEVGRGGARKRHRSAIPPVVAASDVDDLWPAGRVDLGCAEGGSTNTERHDGCRVSLLLLFDRHLTLQVRHHGAGAIVVASRAGLDCLVQQWLRGSCAGSNCYRCQGRQDKLHGKSPRVGFTFPAGDCLVGLAHPASPLSCANCAARRSETDRPPFLYHNGFTELLR
jgi:hypothetical protein